MALTAAPEDQALLLDLQELDTRLQQLAHKAASLPEIAEIARLEAEAAELRRTATARTGELEDARAELGRVEADVAVVTARVERDRGRLDHAATAKDAQALEQELAALAKRTSDLEDIQLAVMETVEEREAALAETTDALAGVDERIAVAVAARDAALAELEGERTHVAANRATVAGKVPADLLALYERQRERYGVGASLLRGGVTGATGVALTASDLATVRAAAPDAVLICPDSNAVLVRTAESGL